MREFKCKARRKDNNEWVFGYIDETMYKDITVIHTDASTFEVYRDTIGFPTGLRDKEGTMIYDGDIVGYDGRALDSVVYYDNNRAAYFRKRISGEVDAIEPLCVSAEHLIVIGNVFDLGNIVNR